MPYFSDISQLEKELKEQIIQALKEKVGTIIKEELKKQIQNKVYSHQSGSLYGTGRQYQRTYELLKSIEIDDVKEENGVYTVQVYFNLRFTHESWWGSQKLGIRSGDKVGMNYIAQWLNEGKNEFASHTEGFIEDTESELNQTKIAIKSFLEHLKSKGIEII